MARGRGQRSGAVGGRGRPPSERPSKLCPVCQRPFQWRKKWATVWEQVIYCSDRCRNQGPDSKKPTG